MGRRSPLPGVSALGERIQIRFEWRGRELRPTLPLRPTAANLKAAARLRDDILQEIREGRFELARHFPDYRFAERVAAEPGSPAARTLLEWFEVWARLQAREVEHSSISVYRRHMKAYWLSAWGGRNPREITNEMVRERLAELAGERVVDGKVRRGLGRKTQNNILVPLRGTLELAAGTLPNLVPGTEGVRNLKVQRGDPDPLGLDEVEAALAQLAKLSEELADYFEFACFAGLRTSEQIALLWQDVDLRSGSIAVRRARVMTEEKERTKTHKKRDVELNGRARAVLERQRARTQLAGGVVFRNPFTCRPWNDDQEQRREWAAALKLAGVRYRPPKECRDTSVTLALIAGADPVWVAAQHGHSLTVMMRDYARWIPRQDEGRNLDRVNTALGFRSSNAVVSKKSN